MPKTHINVTDSKTEREEVSRVIQDNDFLSGGFRLELSQANTVWADLWEFKSARVTALPPCRMMCDDVCGCPLVVPVITWGGQG